MSEPRLGEYQVNNPKEFMNPLNGKGENEMIAEFMGVDYNHGINCKYDTSWDWLMPVVEKIRKIYAESEQDRHIHAKVDPFRCNILFADLALIHQGAVNFIKWYTSQLDSKPKGQ